MLNGQEHETSLHMFCLGYWKSQKRRGTFCPSAKSSAADRQRSLDLGANPAWALSTEQLLAGLDRLVNEKVAG